MLDAIEKYKNANLTREEVIWRFKTTKRTNRFRERQNVRILFYHGTKVAEGVDGAHAFLTIALQEYAKKQK